MARDQQTLTLVFEVYVGRKLSCRKPVVPVLSLPRTTEVTLKQVTEHLETHLLLPNGQGHLLLLAVCSEEYRPRNVPGAPHRMLAPLVCNQVLVTLVTRYPRSRIKIVVEKAPTFNGFPRLRQVANLKRFLSLKELKLVDAKQYFPRKLRQKDLHQLCRRIFYHDLRISKELRKGIWPHLLGVYPPQLQTQEEREAYFEKLRRIYDALKGKWETERDSQMNVQHLYDSVRRDAYRTDPGEPFFENTGDGRGRNEEDNVMKLINITVIYTLEHGEVAYTQGMTDLLSPILFVMQREADAYICFAAMMERIRQNFSVWCEGTLNKLERLCHLCQVLDPQLYGHMANFIQEDTFSLFFGMVLIECKREFTFASSFHLLEVIWAAAKYLQEHTTQAENVSQSQWSRYLTYKSPEVIQQVFGEAQPPYTAEPLGRTISMAFQQSSRQASVGSYTASPGPQPPPTTQSTYPFPIPIPFQTTREEDEHNQEPYHKSSPFIHIHPNGRRSPFEQITPETVIEETRARSYTDPSHHTFVREPEENVGRGLAMSPNQLTNSHSESNLYISPRSNPASQLQNPAEMSNLSSLSSSNNNGSYKSTDSRNTPSSSGRSENTEDRTPRPTVVKSSKAIGRNSSQAGIIFGAYSRNPSGRPKSPPPAPITRQSSGQSSYHTAAEGSGGASSKLSASLVDDSVERDGVVSTNKPTRRERELTGSNMSFQYPSSNMHFQPDERRTVGVDPHPEDFTQSRVSPIPPFFDTVERLATGLGRAVASQQNDSEMSSMIMSQLMSIEQSAPHITRLGSLQVSVADTFPLFVCLALLIQNRSRIIRERLDFVGLSVLLNGQAGTQNLDHTLRIARELYSTYRHYQEMYFGQVDGAHLMWLDDPGTADQTEGTETAPVAVDNVRSPSTSAVVLESGSFMDDS